MSVLDRLDRQYRLILCDIWGVIHDGVRLYPGASDRLCRWREQGRCICLITNAPRTASAVEQQLEDLGMPRHAYDFVASSGEAGIGAVKRLRAPVGFIGTRDDRAILEGRGVRIAEGSQFSDLVCTGITAERPDPEGYRPELEALADRGVKLHCLNPDRVVMRGGVLEACAGALADIYEENGGSVTWYGKPYPAIYQHVLDRAGSPAPTDVLAIGDGLQTDMLGAARMGMDAVFVTGGIHNREPFPREFAAINGLGEWEPVAIVEDIA